MAFLDWLRRRGSVPAGTEREWLVWVEDDAVVVAEHERDQTFARAMLAGARSVRVVPLTRGTHHASANGWQVCLTQPDGDVLIGAPLPGWQDARDLAQRVCKASRLPMDETTQKLFSRVGRIQDGRL